MRDLFFEIHSGLLREAPGDDASTARALALIPSLPQNPLILDIGCGPGAQSLVLGRNSGGLVVALDNHFPYLKVLQNRASSAGLDNRIRCLSGTMFRLPFQEMSFDLIWSEGAVYIMGFVNGLKEWRRFLKSGGFLAVTELCWLEKSPPRDILDYWRDAYPGMKTMAQNAGLVEASGYKLLDSFVLPGEAWWENYYGPLEERIGVLQEKYRGNAEAGAVLDEEMREIEVFRNDPGSYGYAFFVMRKSS